MLRTIDNDGINDREEREKGKGKMEKERNNFDLTRSVIFTPVRLSSSCIIVDISELPDLGM